MKQLISASLLSLTLIISGCASTTDSKHLEYLTYVEAGQLVPVTEFTDIQGNLIDLNQSSNAKLIVLFATWCPDSQRAMKALEASDLNLDPNVDIIAIGREDNREALDKFATDYEINFPLIADTDRSIYAKFANAGVPRLILLDAKNTVVKTIIGEGENPLAEIQW
ncbi:TlpA disulfide reductase family protein [Shewanella sp. UCD-KL12]|uniref:TlpA family protein disulfide reductase n=1 Tax=Shewanella sp. UCD-KL12 TaxID=1917163 RepID=UPI000970B1D5|nr:TlpA disulfide reductase family protein [Shewanella sp. UCD-KL12]